MKNTVLVQARVEAGFTQAQLAEKAGISENSYQRYELGQRDPQAKVANRIARAVHKTALELFGT